MPSNLLQHQKVSDPLAIRTIVIVGLPESIDSNSLWKKIRKYEGAEKVEWPISTASGDDITTGES
jgi:nucleolar protein 4